MISQRTPGQQKFHLAVADETTSSRCVQGKILWTIPQHEKPSRAQQTNPLSLSHQPNQTAFKNLARSILFAIMLRLGHFIDLEVSFGHSHFFLATWASHSQAEVKFLPRGLEIQDASLSFELQPQGSDTN